MKWIQEEIGAIEIECKEYKFSWPRKQSLMALLLLAAFSGGRKKYCLCWRADLRLNSAKNEAKER